MDKPPLKSRESRLQRLRRAPLATLQGRLRRLRREIADLPHDIRLGVRTAAITSQYVDWNEQNAPSDPVPYRTLGGIARHMTAQKIAARRFADIGSGMGRPLYFFAGRFDELIGYELVAPIHARASAQLARAQATRGDFRRISILCADATTTVPLDLPLVAFLYNPFGRAPMARLCARLREARCDVHIYYANPVLRDVLVAAVGEPADMFRCDVDVAYFHVRD
jgi:hypothetical protein